jgi:branched-chain amino acid transport system permease protein
MVTLGVALLLHEIANALPQWTGGADGLQGMTVGPLLGRFDFDLFGRTAYAYSLGTLFVLFLVARCIVNSPFGLSLMAIRRNPLRAAALGVPVNPRLVAIYALAAAYAGAAGALLAQTAAYVSLEVLDFQRSADVLLALIIGGAGWLYGGLAGAVVFKILQDALAAGAPQFWMFWMGLFLVVLALVGRERITRGAAEGLRGLLARAGR